MISVGIASLITLVALSALKPFAKKVGLVDVPGGRKQHEVRTPLIGGVGIFAGAYTLAFLDRNAFMSFVPLFVSAGFVLAAGVWDDLVELSPTLRLWLHLLAGMLMVFWGGNQLSALGNLFGAGTVMLGVMAVPITLFAVASAINAVNMTDGVDGLCGGVALIFLSYMGCFANRADLVDASVLIAVLICSIVGFLLLNFRFPWRRQAAVFMGDAGSTVIGFVLAWLLIYLAEHRAFPPVVALWIIAYPLVDTASVMLRRRLRGGSMLAPGRDHLHHLLQDMGFSVRQTVFVIYALAAAFGGIGLIGSLQRIHEGVMLLGFILVLAGYMAGTYGLEKVRRRHASAVVHELRVAMLDEPVHVHQSARGG